MYKLYAVHIKLHMCVCTPVCVVLYVCMDGWIHYIQCISNINLVCMMYVLYSMLETSWCT